MIGYTCKTLLPHLVGQGYGKIINLSGGGATSPMPRISAYAASKVAVVRFTETLATEVGDGIDVNAISPGALATRLLDQVVEAGPDAVGQDFHERMLQIQAEGGTPLEKGSALAVYLASAESVNPQTGTGLIQFIRALFRQLTRSVYARFFTLF